MIILEKTVQNNSMFGELFTTIIAGVFVFMLSQYVLELIIRPHIRYKEIKYKILNGLKFYSRIITNPLDFEFFEESPLLQNEFTEQRRREYQDKVNNYMKISDEIRKLSCELDEFYYAIPKWYRRMVFRNDEVEQAGSNLIAISNSLFRNPSSGFDVMLHNSNKLDEIKKQLRLS